MKPLLTLLLSMSALAASGQRNMYEMTLPPKPVMAKLSSWDIAGSLNPEVSTAPDSILANGHLYRVPLSKEKVQSFFSAHSEVASCYVHRHFVVYCEDRYSVEETETQWIIRLLPSKLKKVNDSTFVIDKTER